MTERQTECVSVRECVCERERERESKGRQRLKAEKVKGPQLRRYRQILC